MTENLPAPAWFDPQKILDQVLSGKRTETIAAELGTTRARLIYQLTTKAPEEWKAAQLVRDIRRKEEAEDEIDKAKDMLELNRAQAKLRSTQWSLERVCSRIYGQVKDVEHPEKISITLNIGTSSDNEPRVINAGPQEWPSGLPPSLEPTQKLGE